MGEYRCRVCGLLQDEPIWGEDGRSSTFDICACCGCEFGYEDVTPSGVADHRERWLAGGARWFRESEKPPDWDEAAQLRRAGRFYIRTLDGLPVYGPEAVPFSSTGHGKHSTGFVVEFSLPDGTTWIGNFHGPSSGLSIAVPSPVAPEQAIVVSRGDGYVVVPATKALVKCFGGGITDVLRLPGTDTLIFGNGLWLESLGHPRGDWRTRRISWDGTREVRLEGDRITGLAFMPGPTPTWVPFEVDAATGKATGGSYSERPG